MSTNPIDIVANALSEAGWVPSPPEGMAAAAVAANALTDERIVASAVQALKHEGWTSTPEGPHGEYRFADDELADIARVVLRSVGGA